jgi:hypothetical protein
MGINENLKQKSKFESQNPKSEIDTGRVMRDAVAEDPRCEIRVSRIAHPE